MKETYVNLMTQRIRLWDLPPFHHRTQHLDQRHPMNQNFRANQKTTFVNQDVKVLVWIALMM
jgi:hypothetical protein